MAITFNLQNGVQPSLNTNFMYTYTMNTPAVSQRKPNAKVTDKKDIIKIGAVAAVTALATATVTTFVCRRYFSKQMKNIEKECEKKISKFFDENSVPVDFYKRHYGELKAKIDETGLNYDIMKPPEIELSGFKPRVFDDAVEMPEKIKYFGNKYYDFLDFDNEFISVKVLEPDQKGAIYIEGREREFQGGFKGGALFIKILPSNYNSLTEGGTLNSADLFRLAMRFARDARISNDDKIRLITQLEPVWPCENESELAVFLANFINNLSDNLGRDVPFHINFPKDKYCSGKIVSNSLNPPPGFKICKDCFEKLGMQNWEEAFIAANIHVPIVPTEIEKRKIVILKEAIKILAPSLREKGFRPEEIDTKIFLFDRTAQNESKLAWDCCAQAIVDDRNLSKGFWLDKTVLDTWKFSSLLETALHELSHKIGNDESAEFSYLLTGVNERVFTQLLNTETYSKLCALNKLWTECTNIRSL